VALVQLPAMVEYFKGFFPGWSHSANPLGANVAEKWLNLPSMAPHGLWTAKRKAEVQPWTDNS